MSYDCIKRCKVGDVLVFESPGGSGRKFRTISNHTVNKQYSPYPPGYLKVVDVCDGHRTVFIYPDFKRISKIIKYR